MRLTRWRPASLDASSSPRRRLLSAAGFLVVTGLLLAGPTAGVENDFSFYPAAAHACLGRAAARSACRGDSVGELNACLCGNGSGFVTETARCLGAGGGGGELAAVYATMEAACDGSQTPLRVSQTEFLALAGQGGRTSKAPPRTTTREAATKTMTSEASTAAPSTSTPASTSASATPSPTDVGGSASRHQLSQGATAGIATGASVGGVAAVALVAFLLFQHRRRRRGEATTEPPSGAPAAASSPSAADHKPVWSPYEWPATQPPVYEMDGSSPPQPTQGSGPWQLPAPT